MTLPPPTSNEPARSRRTVLAAAVGGVIASVAATVGGPARTLAAHLPGFGHPNNAGSDNTTLATNSTGTALLVQQNGTGTALRGVANNGIAGFFTSVNGSGVSGVVAANNKYGVYGGNDALTFGGGAAIRANGQQNHGLVATTVNPAANAVRGVNTASDGTGVSGSGALRGGSFLATEEAGNPVGVYGSAPGTQAYGGIFEGAVGVKGASVVPENGIAVWAPANPAATGFPVGILASAPSNGRAGEFSGHVNIAGNLSVTGTLTKGAGAFKIDHPLDPANRYLSHSFVESPDMLNVYSGNVTTNADGNVTVELPAWFEALNQDYRYQLTVIGGFAQAAVADEIADGRFAIKTDKPNVKVSWQVTGVRHDPYAEAHRIPVDERKPANERGTFLHPIEHGQPASKGLDARRQRTRPEPLQPPELPRIPDLPAGL